MKLKLLLEKNKQLAISTAASIVLVATSGCSGMFIEPKDVAEVQLGSDVTEYSLNSNSLMQQLMASGFDSGNAIIFTKSSSDRVVDATLGNTPFDIVFKASSEEQKVVVKGTLTGKGKKELHIYQADSSVDKMKKTPIESALSLVQDKVAPLGTRLKIDGSATKLFIENEAKKYDENGANEEKTVYGFLQYASSSAHIQDKRLFFDYNKRLNVITISEDPIAIISSPYRAYLIKKQLDENLIKYTIVGESSIVVDGGFSDWGKAYKLYERIDPFVGQTYVVSSEKGSFEVQEGYFTDRPIRIEFLGWNGDGTRSYVFYDNEKAQKIITSSRYVHFKSGEKNYRVRLF